MEQILLTRNRSPEVDVASILNEMASHRHMIAGMTSVRPVLGIDASATKIGVSVAYREYLYTWVYRPKTTGVIRQVNIRAYINKLLSAVPYTLAVLEGYSFRSIGRQYTIGECVGVVRMGLYDAGIDTIIMSPLALKKFTTGTAKSNKAAVTLGLYKRWGIELTQEDEADAAGLAMVAAYETKAISGTTAYQSEAMKKTERLF